MLILLYSLLLTVGLAIASPWWLLRMVTTERYREGLRGRLGRVPETLRDYVAGKRVVWIHAVSVGEVLAASRLVSELGEALGEDWRVVVSTTTRTGQTLARERFGADRVFYFPFDFAFAVRAYMKMLKPASLVLMESEIWPRMLHECAKEKIPVAVINARVSDRSFKRGTKLRVLWGRALKRVSLWLAQSEEDARRLVALGALNVHVGGNLKYDVRAPKGSWIVDKIREVAIGRPVVVAGSTVGDQRFDEERMILAAWRGAARTDFKALLVIAPRHPERFESVANQTLEYRSIEASSLLTGVRTDNEFTRIDNHEGDLTEEVIVLNTIGDLAAVYALADVAFVGGSLVPKGGHNPLEPAQFGVPVVIGSSYENFRVIVTVMEAADGIRIVQDDVELEEVLLELLTNKEAARAMGERGHKVFEEQQGATKRAVEAIVGLVKR